MISSISRLNLSDPRAVATHFEEHRNSHDDKFIEDMGFGWKIWQTGIGGGYASILAEFYYYKDSVVGYRLTPNMPTEDHLQGKYRKWYSRSFEIVNDEALSRSYPAAGFTQPLTSYVGPIEVSTLSDSLRIYMSPAVGTMYGRGFKGQFENREYFDAVRDKVTDEMLWLYAHSINPATRLTAIEQLRKRGALRLEEGARASWVEQVYHEPMMVRTLFGCRSTMEPASALVEMMLTIED